MFTFGAGGVSSSAGVSEGAPKPNFSFKQPLGGEPSDRKKEAAQPFSFSGQAKGSQEQKPSSGFTFGPTPTLNPLIAPTFGGGPASATSSFSFAKAAAQDTQNKSASGSSGFVLPAKAVSEETSALGAKEAPTGWKCAACETENPDTSKACSLCMAAKPGSLNPFTWKKIQGKDTKREENAEEEHREDTKEEEEEDSSNDKENQTPKKHQGKSQTADSEKGDEKTKKDSVCKEQPLTFVARALPDGGATSATSAPSTPAKVLGSQSTSASTPCPFFKTGSCRRGNSCPLVHAGGSPKNSLKLFGKSKKETQEDTKADGGEGSKAAAIKGKKSGESKTETSSTATAKVSSGAPPPLFTKKDLNKKPPTFGTVPKASSGAPPPLFTKKDLDKKPPTFGSTPKAGSFSSTEDRKSSFIFGGGGSSSSSFSSLAAKPVFGTSTFSTRGDAKSVTKTPVFGQTTPFGSSSSSRSLFGPQAIAKGENKVNEKEQEGSKKVEEKEQKEQKEKQDMVNVTTAGKTTQKDSPTAKEADGKKFPAFTFRSGGEERQPKAGGNDTKEKEKSNKKEEEEEEEEEKEEEVKEKKATKESNTTKEMEKEEGEKNDAEAESEENKADKTSMKTASESLFSLSTAASEASPSGGKMFSSFSGTASSAADKGGSGGEASSIFSGAAKKPLTFGSSKITLGTGGAKATPASSGGVFGSSSATSSPSPAFSFSSLSSPFSVPSASTADGKAQPFKSIFGSAKTTTTPTVPFGKGGENTGSAFSSAFSAPSGLSPGQTAATPSTFSFSKASFSLGTTSDAMFGRADPTIDPAAVTASPFPTLEKEEKDKQGEKETKEGIKKEQKEVKGKDYEAKAKKEEEEEEEEEVEDETFSDASSGYHTSDEEEFTEEEDDDEDEKEEDERLSRDPARRKRGKVSSPSWNNQHHSVNMASSGDNDDYRSSGLPVEEGQSPSPVASADVHRRRIVVPRKHKGPVVTPSGTGTAAVSSSSSVAGSLKKGVAPKVTLGGSSPATASPTKHTLPGLGVRATSALHPAPSEAGTAISVGSLASAASSSSSPSSLPHTSTPSRASLGTFSPTAISTGGGSTASLSSPLSSTGDPAARATGAGGTFAKDHYVQLVRHLEQVNAATVHLVQSHAGLQKEVQMYRALIQDQKTKYKEQFDSFKEAVMKKFMETQKIMAKENEELKKKLSEMEAKYAECLDLRPLTYTHASVEELKALEEKLYQKRKEVKRALEKRAKTDDKLCTICVDDEKNTVFVPCGHVSCCWNCASSESLSHCPICRDVIQARVRLFHV